jgi:LemA protein
VKAIIAILVVIVLGGAIYGLTYWSTYNGLVSKQESTNEGKSKFASAVNMCSQKMKSVWALADQEGILEKETYVGVAKARSAFDDAKKEFDQAKDDKSKSILDLTKLGANFGQALVNVRVAFEAYPQLRTTETYQKAMNAVEEGFNEIKTALDDWITLCKNYNQTRRSLVTNWFAANWSQFPQSIAYYEGGIKEPEQVKVTTEDLNPKAIKPEKP